MRNSGIGVWTMAMAWGLLLGCFLAIPAPLRAAQEAPQAAASETGQTAAAQSPAESNGDYRVGSGDVVEVSVWREQEASGSVVVRPDGKISLPLVNDLYVRGMTPMEMQKVITEKLEPFINEPNVTVIVRQILSKKVYVIGQVGRPGAYQVTQPMTILQLLTEAGGLQPFAKEKDIYVLRTANGKQERFSFNYKDVLRGKNMQQNILLEPGDTVVVP